MPSRYSDTLDLKFSSVFTFTPLMVLSSPVNSFSSILGSEYFLSQTFCNISFKVTLKPQPMVAILLVS